MKLAFYSNYLNHHQVLVADELYHLLGDEYAFVATLPRNENELKGGADYSTRSYCILAGESEEAHQWAITLAREAEACVFGACSQEYAVIRAKSDNCGLSFELGERWMKRGWINILSPTLRTWWWNYRKYYKDKPYYKLCCSAFTAQDDEKLHAYRGRHYKWGYFTSVPEKEEREKLKVRNEGVATKILWCARFLSLKHPELALKLAKKLKGNGYSFEMTFVGNGKVYEKSRTLAKDLNVEDVVTFMGSIPNQDVLSIMSEHDIFLFTSDRYEGWGAVSNESMSHRCCLVGSDEIGSIPYLIRNRENGMIFKSKSIDSLYEKVSYLLDHPNERERMAKQGYSDMVSIWSPQNAAKNLLQLIDDIKNNCESSIKEGPCSKNEVL